MLPWIVVLHRQLPSTATVTNWNLAWVGLDTLEAALLISGGLLHRSGHRWQSLPLAGASAVLLLDAWLDITTSTGRDQLIAAAMLGVELPLALLCLHTAAESLNASSEPR